MSKSQLFISAWFIARTASAKFGGSVKSYFSEALKMAYAQQNEKEIIEITTQEKLIAMGLKVWEKNGYRRIYFNKSALENIFGLEVDLNKSGKVSYATISGDKISNNTANEWLEDGGYYDCIKNKMVGAFAMSKRLHNILENA